MASTHIEVPSTASRLSSSFRQLISNLRDVQELSIEVKDIADQVAAGGDWATLATYLGISAGDAETVYNLLTAANTAIGASEIDSLLARCG
jgi:hypothetical protein